MEVFGDKKTSKNIKQFYCELCDFSCYKKGDWNRHKGVVNLAHGKTTETCPRTDYRCGARPRRGKALARCQSRRYRRRREAVAGPAA